MKNLIWIKEDTKYILKNDEARLPDLSISLAKSSSFIILNKLYKISRKGFWKSVISFSLNCKQERC